MYLDPRECSENMIEHNKRFCVKKQPTLDNITDAEDSNDEEDHGDEEFEAYDDEEDHGDEEFEAYDDEEDHGDEEDYDIEWKCPNDID